MKEIMNYEGGSLAVKNPIATIQMENGNKIKVELYTSVAPNTVKNFIYLSQEGLYNGLIFHRVGRFSHIQTGRLECSEKSYRIKGEFTSNGHLNEMKLEREAVAMCTIDGNTVYSQFYIMTDTPPVKQGDFAIFGRVIEGMNEVDRISQVKVDENLRPIEDQKIQSITIETFGEIYEEPEKLTY